MERPSNEEISLANRMKDGCGLGNNPAMDNNNDEEYVSEYPMDARLIGAGRQSADAFSTSDGEDYSNSSGDNSPSHSGRSSADQANSNEDTKVLNSICNMMPEVEEASKLVDIVRSRFLNSIQGETDQFDSLDLNELQKPLPRIKVHEQSLTFRLISRYLNFNTLLEADLPAEKKEKELNAAVESLRGLLKFRLHYRLSEAVPESFTQEFFILNGIFPFGCDKRGIPVLYLRARVHRRWSPRVDEIFRRYVAWHIDRITKSNHGAKVNKQVGTSGIEKDGSFGICFDCHSLSYSCLDMDFLKFLVTILVQYYPTYCRYALCVDLPWLFRSVWKLVRSWLPEEAQNTVQLISAKELVEYIDEDQIPNSIKIGESKASISSKRKHQLPKNFDKIKNFDVLARELNIGSSELKQMKAHVEKVRKEYEELGAL